MTAICIGKASVRFGKADAGSEAGGEFNREGCLANITEVVVGMVLHGGWVGVGHCEFGDVLVPLWDKVGVVWGLRAGVDFYNELCGVGGVWVGEGGSW